MSLSKIDRLNLELSQATEEYNERKRYILNYIKEEIQNIKKSKIFNTKNNSRFTKILLCRLYKRMTLDEVAKKFGFTRERIRQIEGKALEEIRCFRG